MLLLKPHAAADLTPVMCTIRNSLLCAVHHTHHQHALQIILGAPAACGNNRLGLDMYSVALALFLLLASSVQQHSTLPVHALIRFHCSCML